MLFALLKLICYEEIDDFMIEDILAGYSSDPNPYAIYINIFISYPVMMLYKIIPTINWYAIMLLFFQFISFLVIGNIILKSFNKKIGIKIYLLLCLTIYIPMLFCLSYTSVSGILAIAGLVETVYLLSTTNSDLNFKDNTKKILLIVIFVITSFMLRFVMMLLYFVFLSIILLHYTLKRNKNVKRIIMFNFILLTILIVIYLLHCYIYSLDSDNSMFKQNNFYRSILQDFIQLHLNYDKNKDIITSANLSKNDFILFSNFCNADENVFSTGTLKKLVVKKIQKDKILSLFNLDLYSILKNLVLSWLTLYLFAFLLLILIYLITLKNNKLMNTVLFLCTMLMHLFNLSINKSVFRVNIILYTASIIILLIINKNYLKKQIQNSRAKHFYKLVYLALIITIVLYNSLLNYYINKTNREMAETSYSALFKYTEKHKQNIYITLPLDINNRFYLFDNVFTTQNKHILTNLKVLGSWDCFDKRYVIFKNENEINSLYSALIQKENFYLVINNEYPYTLSCIIEFLNEHYTKNEIIMNKIDDVNETFSIYKLSII